MSDIEAAREEKYNLLKGEILDQGYDPLSFQIYCEQLKKDGSDDIDAWDYEELKQTIKEFKQKEDEKEKRMSTVSSLPLKQQSEEEEKKEEEKKEQGSAAQRSSSTPTSDFQVSKNIDDMNFKVEIECKVPQRTPLTDYIMENSNKVPHSPLRFSKLRSS